MVMPLLSVSFIGLTVGVIVAIVARLHPLNATTRSLVGAWVGFIAGGLIGVAIDIVTGTGATLAILGHAGAGAGAVAALSRLGAETSQTLAPQ